MGHSPVQNGRYVDFLPTAVSIPADASTTITRERILTIAFATHPTHIAGSVRLQGPLLSAGVPASLRDSVDATATIVAATGDDPTARALIRRPPDEFPTGPYTLTVTITGPANLIAGCPGERLTFSRRIFVEFTMLQETRVRGGGGGGTTIRSNQRALEIGDPSSLELAYLLQFGRFFPQHMQLMQFEQSPPAGGSALIAQFAQYFGALKKYNGYLGQIRSYYHLARTTGDVWHHRGEALRADFAPAEARRWMTQFAETAGDLPPGDIRIALNQVRYNTSHRELIGRIGNQGTFPRARAARGVQVLGYVGTVFDVIDMGVNAVQYGERVNIALDQEHSLFSELRRMAQDQDAYSLLKFAQLESIRQSIVRRRAEAFWQLCWAPTGLLGFIPGPGWLTAAISAAGFLANSIETANRNEIVDYFEQFSNSGLLRTQFQTDISTRGYDSALAGDDAAHTAQRMVTQFSIRAKLLYDMKNLVDDNRGADVERLAGWILRQDDWKLHRRCVFGMHHTYDDWSALRESGGGHDFVRVHFQEHFPIDYWCGNHSRFISWYRQDNTPEIHLLLQPPAVTGTGTLRMPIGVGIRNFAQPFGFDENVEGFMFFHEPALTDREIDEMQPLSADLYQRPWAQRLHRMVSRINHRMDSVSRIRELSDFHFYPPFTGFQQRGGRREALSQELNFHIGMKNYLILLFTPVENRALLGRLFFLCRWPGAEQHFTVFEVKGSKLVQAAGMGATREITFI